MVGKVKKIKTERVIMLLFFILASKKSVTNSLVRRDKNFLINISWQQKDFFYSTTDVFLSVPLVLCSSRFCCFLQLLFESGGEKSQLLFSIVEVTHFPMPVCCARQESQSGNLRCFISLSLIQTCHKEKHRL